MHHPHRLGACLYVPATHPQLGEIAAGRRLADVRSLIYCTEDAVAEHELPAALAALRHALPQIAAGDTRNHFVRVRNPAVLAPWKTCSASCGPSPPPTPCLATPPLWPAATC